MIDPLFFRNDDKSFAAISIRRRKKKKVSDSPIFLMELGHKKQINPLLHIAFITSHKFIRFNCNKVRPSPVTFNKYIASLL